MRLSKTKTLTLVALTLSTGASCVLVSRAALAVFLNDTAVTLGTLRSVYLLHVGLTTEMAVVVDVGMGSRTC